MNLKEFQDQFQRAVLNGDGTILSAIPDGAHEGKNKLLSVYQDAYALRLVEVIASDHPALQAYLGDEAFDAMARAYLRQHPSRHPNARWVADRLPAFLCANEVYAGNGIICELAKIEHELASAFDSVDARALSMADLAAIAPIDWPQIHFVPHSSSRRFTLHTNAFAIWRAISDGLDVPGAQSLEQPQQILVWRQAGTSMIRALQAEEAMMWDEAVKGVRFGILCELLATFDDADQASARAVGYLRGWIETELLHACA